MIQMNDPYFKKILTTILLAVLIVLAFFLLKPLLLSIIFGIILAFIFSPVYDWLHKKTKMRNLSATLLCVLLILLIIVPLWFLVPVAINESIKIYLASQQMDLVTPLKNFFPSLFASEQLSSEIGSVISSFVTKITNSLMNYFSKLILNFPTLFLQFLVVLFTFFFILRDKEHIIKYVQSLLPFSKEVETKLFKSSRGITVSVLYGQVVIGIVQGIVAGLGFFIFKVPSALLLTILAALAGIFPIIGTAIIWVPVVIYLLVGGNTFAALGVLLFGILSSIIESFLKPVFVSKRTNLNPSIILISMLGGLFMFGILGIILGPLIIAYLLIILDIYRDKKVSGILVQKPEKTQ